MADLSVTVDIGTTWDNRPLSHGHARVHLHQEQDRVIPVTLEADFFDDPAPPAGTKGQPLFGLWEYEVVELFILGEYDRYLELEFCPHGQHLVLLLKGEGNAIKHSLPLEFNATVEGGRWRGEARVPVSYFPASPDKLNAYAIHGCGENRQYEALFPVPQGAFDKPNFHRLKYFAHVNLEPLFKSDVGDVSDIWRQALDAPDH
ncbi:hypothetical protein ISCGN_028329 [Ixodes scapularis]